MVKKKLEPKPPLEYPLGNFDLVYVADDPYNSDENGFLILLTEFNGQNSTPKLIRF